MILNDLGLKLSGNVNNKVPSLKDGVVLEGISKNTCAIFSFLEKIKLEYLVPAVLSSTSYLCKFSIVENLNTKANGDITSITSFRLGFNTSNILNASKVKDKKIVYVTVKTDNMYVSTQLPKNINRAMLVHGTNARTAIISIEETGFFLYGDITGMTGIYLSEFVYY